MTKTKPKRSITKASSSNLSDTKTSTPKSEQITLVVLGFDDQQKPCGARFVGDKPELVVKAAELMDLKVYKANTPDLAAIAKKLPVGRLYANGRGFVPVLVAASVFSRSRSRSKTDFPLSSESTCPVDVTPCASSSFLIFMYAYLHCSMKLPS